MRWLLLLLLPPALFGAGYALMRLGGAAPRLGPPGLERPAALEQAWRAHVAGRPDEVRAQLARLGAEGGQPGVRHEVALLAAQAARDVATLESLAEGSGGAPRSVVAGAQRALARGLAPAERRSSWAQRFVREFPRSWAARALAGEGGR